MNSGKPEDNTTPAEEKDVWDRIADVLEPIAEAVDPPPSEKVEDKQE